MQEPTSDRRRPSSLPILARAAARSAKHALRPLMRLGRLYSRWQETSAGRMHYYDSQPQEDGRGGHHDGGNGRTIFLLHGLGSSSVSLLPLAALMRRHCRVIVPDVMHFSGLSVPTKDRFTCNDHLEVLYEFFERLELDSVDLFGHSIGGAGVLRMATRFPDRTRSVSLVNPGGFSFEFERIRDDLLQDQNGRAARLYEQIVGAVPLLRVPAVRAVGTAIVEDALSSQGVRDLIGSISEKDFVDDVVRQLSCPTLLLWGEEDKFLPIETAWHIVSSLDTVDAFFVRGGSHLLCVEAPYQVYTSLRRFLGFGRAWTAPLALRGSPFKRIPSRRSTHA
jgi:pimeloyl-ACP methyl ester carboxylesterase